MKNINKEKFPELDLLPEISNDSGITFKLVPARDCYYLRVFAVISDRAALLSLLETALPRNAVKKLDISDGHITLTLSRAVMLAEPIRLLADFLERLLSLCDEPREETPFMTENDKPVKESNPFFAKPDKSSAKGVAAALGTAAFSFVLSFFFLIFERNLVPVLTGAFAGFSVTFMYRYVSKKLELFGVICSVLFTVFAISPDLTLGVGIALRSGIAASSVIILFVIKYFYDNDLFLHE